MSIRDQIKACLHEASDTPAEPPKFLHAALREPYRRAVKRGATVTFGKGAKKATELVFSLPDEETLRDVAYVVRDYALVKRIPGTTMLKLTAGTPVEPEQTEGVSDMSIQNRMKNLLGEQFDASTANKLLLLDKQVEAVVLSVAELAYTSRVAALKKEAPMLKSPEVTEFLQLVDTLAKTSLRLGQLVTAAKRF